jgi:hypothetical protein
VEESGVTPVTGVTGDTAGQEPPPVATNLSPKNVATDVPTGSGSAQLTDLNRARRFDEMYPPNRTEYHLRDSGDRGDSTVGTNGRVPTFGDVDQDEVERLADLARQMQGEQA